MSPPTHDVIIVGARPAGAATAMLLARSGLEVLVVDQGTHGADTLSLGLLQPGAVVQLDRWGLLPRLEAALTPKVRHALLEVEGRRERTLLGEPLLAPRRSRVRTALRHRERVELTCRSSTACSAAGP